MSGSPFPGMDPYLEGEMWQEFHGRLANQISQQLIPLLRPKYLQQAIDDCFALVGYEDLLDYSQPPPPPALNETEAAWLELITADL